MAVLSGPSFNHVDWKHSPPLKGEISLSNNFGKPRSNCNRRCPTAAVLTDAIRVRVFSSPRKQYAAQQSSWSQPDPQVPKITLKWCLA